MTDRRQLIRDVSCWALALGVGLALSPSRLGGGRHHRPGTATGEDGGDGGWIVAGGPERLLVDPERPAPLPLVVMAARQAYAQNAWVCA